MIIDDLNLESGPCKRKTMVHVLDDVLGCRERGQIPV